MKPTPDFLYRAAIVSVLAASVMLNNKVGYYFSPLLIVLLVLPYLKKWIRF